MRPFEKGEVWVASQRQSTQKKYIPKFNSM